MPPGTVIRSFASPGPDPFALCWDGRTLWNCDPTANLIYQIDPVTGTVIRSFASPAGDPRGLAWDGRALWNVDGVADLIYQIDPATGTVIRSFATPAGDPRGLAWDGRTLWHSDTGTDLLYQIDPITGTVIRSFASPDIVPVGLAWDGRSLWNCGGAGLRIYQIDPVTGTVIRSFPAPGINPRGLTWDGRTLWHTDTGTDLIYQLSVTPGASYADRVIATGPIGYWDQGEQAGTISFDISGHSPLSQRDGAYTGPTLAQAGIGDGRTSALYDGATDYDNIYSASLAAAFNATEGTLLCWSRVANVGVWADATLRYIMRLAVDNNNVVAIERRANAGQLRWSYRAGSVTEEIALAGLVTIAWFSMALTWSVTGNQVIAYFNGLQTGVPQAIAGAWVGALNAGTTLIGAGTQVPANVWNGWLQHGIVWDRPLTPAEMLSLGVL